MKKIIFGGLLFFAAQSVSAQVNSKLQAYVKEVSYNKQKQLNFIKLKPQPGVNEADVAAFINTLVLNSGTTKATMLKTEKDGYGFSHTRYSLEANGVTVYNKVIVAHCQNGKLQSLNGDLRAFGSPANSFALSEKSALAFALKKVNAKKYKWENKEEEAHIRQVQNKPDFTFYPAGNKVIFEKEGKLYHAYQFNIYAEVPLYRANVFVDAATGKILSEQNLICNVNVPGTAVTKYSGTQPITCDQTGAVFSLRETQRGQGVETYNLNNTANYGQATNFTNNSATWTGIGVDQGARDAHWGAEMTYDYFFLQHNRNSIDNQGFKLESYVHYNTNYVNAFWDGIRMTYGDGNGNSTTIFTALDVCGHEISHGLTSNTSNLDYSDESGALNESYSDIFGTAIENYGRPNNWNWKVGEDLTTNGNGLRHMANPALFSDPDTYFGTFWYTGTADNGGVHTNSGVSNYWYYLLCTGGNGTNDIGSAYNVSSIGMTAASAIAFRALTLYYTPTTDYPTARVLSIQAAKDLYGACSNEVIQTTNAWYAVGVGPQYIPGLVNPDFAADITSLCYLPATINFNNITPDGLSYVWSFGDGATSTATNAVHSYTANGTYAVKLKATGCSNALDSLTKTAYIVINSPDDPVGTDASSCGPGPVSLGATGNALLNWYASPGSNVVLGSGTSFVTPNLSSTTTFYVVNTVTSAPVYGGIPNNPSGGGYLNNASQWQVFDVTQNCMLNSVIVYAQTGTAGNRTVELRDMFGSVIYSTTFNLTAGSNTLVLNYALTPGTGYELGLDPLSASNLYRINTNVSYPYPVGSCLNITGSSAGSGFYYWFYNWKVTKESCTSQPIAVTAIINANPVASVSSPFSQVCSSEASFNVNGSPVGGTFSGAGIAGTVFDPSTAGVGTHTLTYQYSDANGCSDSQSLVVDVSACTGIVPLSVSASQLEVYPNPVTDKVTVKTGVKGLTGISITDASGRLILRQAIVSEEEQVNTSNLAKGLYLLSIQDASGRTVKTARLVKE